MDRYNFQGVGYCKVGGSLLENTREDKDDEGQILKSRLTD